MPCYALFSLMYEHSDSLDTFTAPYKITATNPERILASTPAFSPIYPEITKTSALEVLFYILPMRDRSSLYFGLS